MASTAPTLTERTARLCAEAALFMRDHVLSRVSHDLRSPLNAIHSWAYVLDRKIDSADASAQRALAGIRTGVEQQVHLLETLVDTTRAETRKLHIERAPFALDALVGETVDDARRALADARGVNLAVQGTPTGATLDAGRERIGQALWLMLAFATEASAAGQPRGARRRDPAASVRTVRPGPGARAAGGGPRAVVARAVPARGRGARRPLRGAAARGGRDRFAHAERAAQRRMIRCA